MNKQGTRIRLPNKFQIGLSNRTKFSFVDVISCFARQTQTLVMCVNTLYNGKLTNQIRDQQQPWQNEICTRCADTAQGGKAIVKARYFNELMKTKKFLKLE